MLEFDGVGYGKPLTVRPAVARWRRAAGSARGRCTPATPWSHVAAGRVAGRATDVGVTTVEFADLTDDEIADYVATGEPLNVAGGFTIDGRGGWYVRTVEGDHHNVVGLSLPLLRRLLAELGFAVAEFAPAGRERGAVASLEMSEVRRGSVLQSGHRLCYRRRGAALTASRSCCCTG